jgi:hypothetical protein
VYEVRYAALTAAASRRTASSTCPSSIPRARSTCCAGEASRSCITFPSKKKVGGHRPTKIASRSARAFAFQSETLAARPQSETAASTEPKPTVEDIAVQAKLVKRKRNSHLDPFRVPRTICGCAAPSTRHSHSRFDGPSG